MHLVKRTSRASLRLLGSVGEPINPEAWEWYYHVVGEGRCPIVDTWWQTETGGIMISPLPGAIDLKPGSGTKPFFGVQPALVDDKGQIVEGEGQGNLVMLDSWPGQSRTHLQAITIASRRRTSPLIPECISAATAAGAMPTATTGSPAVSMMSSTSRGTAWERRKSKARSSRIRRLRKPPSSGYPHDLKGQGIYCYITLISGENGDDALEEGLVAHVRKEIGPIASPDLIQFSPGLPKTRSGKIMRRICARSPKTISEISGDTSTLADPTVVDELITIGRTAEADSARPRSSGIQKSDVMPSFSQSP